MLQDAGRARRVTASRVVVLTGAAVLAVLLGLLASGATVPPVLGDPGAFVRWGLPTTATLANLAGAVTLGAIALAVCVLPRGDRSTTGRAWSRSLLIAAVAAGTWTVLALLRLVLAYANVAGRPVGGTGFDAELGLFVSDITLGRILLGVVGIAAVTCVVVLLVTGPRGAVVAGLLAVSALVLQAQSGHASGSTNHELALSSMFLHLAGVSLWVGGLTTLALLAPRLGADLTSVVSRYSVLAAWCFAAIGISGVVNSVLRLGGFAGLTSAYGLLVIAKAVLLGALGVVGWAHRRAIIPRLATSPGRFWGLVLVELAVMGAASGVAAALAAAAPPVPQAPLPDRKSVV